MLGSGPLGSSPLGGSIGALPKELMPDILELVKESNSPLKDIREILAALKDASDTRDYQGLENNSKYSKLKKWIPDTPEKLAAYAALISLVLQLISNGHSEPIQINNTFITEYQVIFAKKAYFDDVENSK
jgi:hypothetical protein